MEITRPVAPLDADLFEVYERLSRKWSNERAPFIGIRNFGGLITDYKEKPLRT